MGWTAKPPEYMYNRPSENCRLRIGFYKKQTNKVESIDQDWFFQNGPLLMCIQLCMHRVSVCKDK